MSRHEIPSSADAAPAAAPKIDTVVAKFIELRDAKSKLKAAYESEAAKYDLAMDRCENFFRAELTRAGVDSFVCKGVGTVYKTTKTAAKVENWSDSFLPWVLANEKWDMLKKDVAKSAVEAHLNEHQELPPGVTLHKEIAIGIRRA